MKILYCADLHGKGKSPVSRLDNYYQSWLEKIKEITSIAKSNECELIICGGDVFDSPHVSNTIVDDFVDIVEESLINWLVVPGNHDEIGHSWKNSKATALAHIFRRTKFIEQLTDLDLSDTLENVYIKGYEYNHDIETDLKEKGLLIQREHKTFTIAVPHAFISIKPFFKEVNHICAKDLDTNFDLVLCSHFHMTFDETINGTRFINPNSIGRTLITEQHTPQVLIIDTETRDIEKINLKSAKPAHEIFDLTKYEETKEDEKGIDEFIASLNNYEWQGMDVRNQIKTIGEEQEVDKNIIDYIFNKIEEIENE